MLLFVGALFAAIRVYIPEVKDHGQALKRDVGTLLKTKHEPRRDDENFGMVATLLGSINDPARAIAPDAASAAAIAARDRFVASVAQLASTALHPSVSERKLRDATHNAWSVLRNIGADGQVGTGADDGAQWIDKVMTIRPRIQGEKPTLLIPANQEKSPQSTHDADFGSAGALNDDDRTDPTRIIVSSVQNTDETHTDFVATPRVQRAAAVGELLRLAVQIAMPEKAAPIGAAESETTAAFVQAYFVSVDNVLAIWQRQTYPGRQTLFPASRFWAAQNYFEQLVKTAQPEFETRAYIDFGGYGVVKTKCIHVMDGTAGKERLLGAVCGDVTVPIAQIRSSIAGSHLIDALDIGIEMRSSSTMDSSQVTIAPVTEDMRRRQGRHDGAEAMSALSDALRDQLVAACADYRKGDASGANGIQLLAQTITPLRIRHNETWLLVPLGLTSGTHMKGFVVHENLVGPSSRYLLIATVLGVLALCAVVFGADQSRRHAESDIVGNLLANLDVGIAITDEFDRIEAANGRAEQILGQELPKFEGALGFRRGRIASRRLPATAKTFSELIENTIRRIDRDGNVLAPQKYKDVIPRQRRQGESSTYYARLALGSNKGKLIRVSAAPILARDLSRNAEPRTFGIIESWAVIPEPASIDGDATTNGG
jgi:PAS domain-containing protein